MTNGPFAGIAAVGDVSDPGAWSGIPFHFWQAASRAGWEVEPWRLHLESFGAARRWWNLGQALRGRRPGGYQYSQAFLNRAEAGIPPKSWQGRVLTFNQHFPRGRSAAERGCRLTHYIDATFASFCAPRGLAEHLPARVRAKAMAEERDNYAASERVVTMARWSAESVIRNCGVPTSKVTTILPGANLDLPNGYAFPVPIGQPGRDRPLVLGFVGKDWKRKGLPFLIDVRAELERMGLPAVIRCAGRCPVELGRKRSVDYVGFIDKVRDPDRFVGFLAGCDVGCLFSEREPLGISTLEFLRAGVPVAGFMVEGVADTVPPDAGFRFDPGTPAETVALTLSAAFSDESVVGGLRAAARAWSPLVTWERCVEEWRQLLAKGLVKHPVQPWLGLNSCAAVSNRDSLP
jgi:glycosyltransferase involved in cell wall biosynthesis